MTTAMKAYAFKEAYQQPWDSVLMPRYTEGHSPLTALSLLNKENQDDQWTFAHYMHNSEVREKFFELAKQIIKLAKTLPIGERAYEQWHIDEDQIRRITRIANKVRAEFNYESLD